VVYSVGTATRCSFQLVPVSVTSLLITRVDGQGFRSRARVHEADCLDLNISIFAHWHACFAPELRQKDTKSLEEKVLSFK